MAGAIAELCEMSQRGNCGLAIGAIRKHSVSNLCRDEYTITEADAPPIASDFVFEEPEGDPGFWVNSTTAGAQSGAVYGRFNDGGFAVAFASADTAANGADIRMRLFNADGTPVGGDFVVSQTVAGNQASPGPAGAERRLHAGGLAHAGYRRCGQ